MSFAQFQRALRHMTIQRFVRAWLWIAIACCAVCLMVAAVTLYADEVNDCLARGLDSVPPWRNQGLKGLKGYRFDIFAMLFVSAFMVFFFIWGGREKAIKSAVDFNSEYGHFRVIHERIPITFLHAIFGVFCAGTLAAPIFAIACLGSALASCPSSL